MPKNTDKAKFLIRELITLMDIMRKDSYGDIDRELDKLIDILDRRLQQEKRKI